MMYTKGKRRLAGALALLLCFSCAALSAAAAEEADSFQEAFVQEGLPEQEIVTDVPLPPEAMQPYVEDVPIVRAQMEEDSADAGMTPSDAVPNPEPSYAAEAEYFPGFEMWERSQNPSDLCLAPDALQFPSDGMPVPLLYQYDYKNPVCSMWGETKSVASSGCGAAAASMVIAYACKNYDQTPYTLFCEAAEEGRYRGNGLSYETVCRMLSDYGVNSRLVGTTRTGILSALSENKPIIIDMGPGTFTNNGHYIVLRGLDENGRVLVNDPNSPWRSRQSYPAALIVRECKSQCMLVVYTTPRENSSTISAGGDEIVVAGQGEALETKDGVFDHGNLAVVARNSVNLRESPADGRVICSVPLDTVLRISNEVEVDGHLWYEVFYWEQRLYIRGDMLRVLN